MAELGTRTVRSSLAKLANWMSEILRYILEARSLTQFAKLMQIRLSLSKLGPLVCRERVRRTVDLASLGKVCLRSHTSDISVLNELLVWKGYSTQVSYVASTPNTILDLGANTGLAARWFLNRWPQARIVCVEPEPGNVEVLQANLNVLPDYEVLAVAAGASSRTAMLHTGGLEFGYSLLGETGGPSVLVDVTTIPEILDRAKLDRVDLLKVDIEGAEREVFSNCEDWIGRVRYMIVECHGDYSAEDLLEDCSRNGTDFRKLHIEEKPDWGFSVLTAERIDEEGLPRP